jgi:hypothetical protein
MTEAQISSAAFHQALLRSEKRRIYGVIAFVVFFTLIISIRIVVYGSAMSPWGLVTLILSFAKTLSDRRINRLQQSPRR